MTRDVMSRLAAADPVIEMPMVESPERLRRLIEAERPSEPPTERSRRLRAGDPRTLLGLLFALAVCSVVLLFAGGSSDRDLDVAAAAYAATSPQPGIVEAVFLARSYRDGKLATLRQQEWLNATTTQRRELNTLDEPAAHPPLHQVSDWMISRGLVEEWAPASRAGIRLERLPAGLRFEDVALVEHAISAEKIHAAFRGISIDGFETIAFFRSLYRGGQMRLIGRVRRGGRDLWKLESRVIVPARRSRGRSERPGDVLTNDDHTRLIVLVDPNTFLPVTETQVDVAVPGHPRVLVESNLIRYRHLPARAGAAKVFDLHAQHPGARVVRVHPRFPQFRSMPNGGYGFSSTGLRRSHRRTSSKGGR